MLKNPMAGNPSSLLQLLGWSFALYCGLSGCTQGGQVSAISCSSSPTPCLQGLAKVSLETSRGLVLLELDGRNAPITAGNFLDLVRRGVYNQTVFHRVIRSPVPFVVQGGDPASADPRVSPASYGTGNFIDPKTGEARYIPLEFKVKPFNRMIYGKELSPGTSEKPNLLHDRGALAMARSSDPDSASAQFYIALENLPELDGRYAVFGRVIRGMDVVDRIQQGDKLIRAVVVQN